MSTISILGKCLGSCVINDYLILFTVDFNINRIYKVKPPNTDGISGIIKLFEGELNFSESNIIQTLPFYENENIQKVYWIDGLNQPRVINIAIEDDRIFNYSNTSFDFVQNLELKEIALVEKLYTTGYFKSGVIQYAATYFNKNGAESNIFWISDINYISFEDRAGKPDEIIQNAFKITITNLEDKYDYVRLYSIYRTSLDTTPEVKSVIDLKIPNSLKISYIDNGFSGSIISSDFLLYVGGEELVPQCMSQKNNTLFLGNLSIVNNKTTPVSLVTTEDITANGVPNHSSTFEWIENEILFESIVNNNQYYPYKPFTSNIRHFKFDETYRFGLQGQFKNGKWSAPIWLGFDSKVFKRYKMRYVNDTDIYLSYITGKYNISKELSFWLKDQDNGCGFIKIRPVMVPLNYSDRTIIAQGLVNNTLAIMKNRHSGVDSSPFSYPDYMLRHNGVNSGSSLFNGQYTHFDLLKLNNNLNKSTGDTPNKYIEIMGNGDTWDYHDIYDNGTPPYGLPHNTPFGGDYDRDFFFVDKNIVNFWSPDLINNTEVLNSYVRNVESVKLYGFAFQSAITSKFEIDFSEISNSPGSDPLELNKSNYYNGYNPLETLRQRQLFPLITSTPTAELKDPEDYITYHNLPIWSPKDYIISLPYRSGSYNSEKATINFTKLNKSGFNYFGLITTLKDGVNKQYDINNPYLIFNDSSIFYKSNYEDNAQNNGNILYSKSVEKTYPSNSYYNVFKYGKDAIESNIGLKYSKNFAWANGGIGSDDVLDIPINSGLSVKYNTNTHAIFSFKKKDGYFNCMPRLQNSNESSSYLMDIFNPPPSSFYGSFNSGFKMDVINKNFVNGIVSDNTTVNTLPIFDLYTNIDESTKYGGKTFDALYSNSWIPCGNSMIVTGEAMSLNYTAGDTYIGRFDLLRVFPDDLNQIPQHTEIVSFICESFINLDGRSDVNRYNTDSSLMTTGNYGLFNNIYSQKNNYFTYNILDKDLFNTSNYSNTIVWSKTKLSGEAIDTWTGINMLSSIDLDGIYGDISSINLFNSELYAFQPNGIARLLFNERIQQQASDGISLELTNGYKIPEYRYLTNQYGSSNKWSIIEGKGGIYFIDYNNKSFNLLSDGIKDLSSTLGFKSWFNENTDGKNYTLSYDKINNNVYIHDDSICLNYSELLNSFVSFYDYIDTLQMKNIWNKFISIKENSSISQEVFQLNNGSIVLSENGNNAYLSEQSTDKITNIWINNSGEYNKFYDVVKPFSIEYLFNPDPQYDKVFNTFEYRLDNQIIDWTDLSLNNWYQVAELNDAQYKDKLKRKFNVNRVVLPRETGSHNRIRSTWMKMKLNWTPKSTTTNNNNKFEMQDLNITYTI